jgi:cysteine desulfurase/selenocysteine lyase
MSINTLPDPSGAPFDVAALTQLANDLFRQPPGGGAQLPVTPPASPMGVAPPAGGVPLGGLGFTGAIPSGALPPTGFAPQPAPDVPGFTLAGIPPLSASLPDDAQLRALLAPLLSPSSAPGAPGLGAPGLGAPGLGGGTVPGGISGLPQAAPAQPVQSYYFLEEKSLTAAPVIPPSGAPGFHPDSVRRDFPILNERVNGKPLIWLDNAATTQKPRAVIDRLKYFYEHENSNIHRAAHTLAARSTDAYEKARETVRRFINAPSADEIVFVRGATEGINLVAQSWGRRFVGEGDEIIVSHLEHHANIVPWQQLAAEKGAKLRVIPVDDDGQILLDAYTGLLNDRTKIVSITQVSNALGTVTPAAKIIELAHRRGVPVLLDGAQSISHMPVDVQALDADWFIFSGHKVFGPTGIGAVYGKAPRLEEAPPWQGGGNMIEDVTFEKTVYQPVPAKFEAGTGNIADAVGLGAALEYLERVGMENVARHEHALITYATQLLTPIPGLRIIGTAAEKAGVVSFVLDGIATPDVGKALAQEGIAVRAGHHCAQPILRRFGLEATVRPSFALYNNFADIEALAAAVRRIAQTKAGEP